MNHQLIGSRLLVKLFPEFTKRLKDDADYDILIDCEPSDAIKDYFKGLYKSNKIDLHYIPLLNDYDINDPNVFFTLKASHVSFDKVHQPKTFYDIYLLSEKGCVIIEPLFYQLHEFWKEKLGDKWRADFTKESSDFFDDAVSRENVHDELHNLVAYYHQPAFKFLQEPDQTTVWVCPEKFKNTTEHIRQRVVIEEAQTLAIERFGNTKPKHIGYMKMIEGLVDRLAPLWMTIYIMNNFDYFLNFKEDYGIPRN